MTTWLRMVLVLILVGGGFMGFSITSVAIVGGQTEGVSAKAVMAFLAAIYIFIVWAGLEFVQDPNRRILLYAALGLQTVWCSTPLLTYQLWGGANLNLGLLGWKVQAGASFGAGCYLTFFQPTTIGFGVNLVAIALLVLLYHADQIDDEIRRAKLAFD